MLDILLPLAVYVGLVVAVLAALRLLVGPTQNKGYVLLRVLIVLLITMPLAAWMGLGWMNSRTFQLFGDMVDRVETDQPVIALTFDDGPSSKGGQQILDILRAEGVRATFFVEGMALEENMPIAQRMVAEGHALGNHSYSHSRLVGRSYAFVHHEIALTDALIRAAGYEGEILFRPPYGKRLIILPYYLQRAGRTTIMWNTEPGNYAGKERDPKQIAADVLAGARPGSIILLHVMYGEENADRRAVSGIIAGLRARGYTFVTVPELLELRESEQ